MLVFVFQFQNIPIPKNNPKEKVQFCFRTTYMQINHFIISYYLCSHSHVTNFFILVYQLGICCVYIMFIGENLKSIVDHFTQTETDVRMYMLITLLPIILINWVNKCCSQINEKKQIHSNTQAAPDRLTVFFPYSQVRNLKYLAPFSTVANAVTIISFAIICYFMFREPISLEGRRAVGPIAEFPLFFGTVMFSMEAIGVIMPLENEMKTPKSFVGVTGVLNRAFLLIVVMYVGMGLVGYLKYGDSIRESITLNLEANNYVDEM